MTFFLFAAFGISWAAILPFLALPPEIHETIPWLFPLILVARFGPSLAGLAATVRERGTGGARDLLRRLVPRARHTGWIALAALGPLAVAALVAGLEVRRGTPIGPSDPDRFGMLPVFLAQRFFLGGGLGEELGWRGFALPWLQARMHPLVAAVALGLVWAAWHLPAFHLQGSDGLGDSFVVFVAPVVTLSVLFSWFYNRTGGNLFVCVLLHAAVYASIDAFERAWPVLWVTGDMDRAITAFWGAVALLIIAATNGRLGLPAPSR